MMRRIFYYRILDHAHLMEWAMALEEFLNSQSGVGYRICRNDIVLLAIGILDRDR